MEPDQVNTEDRSPLAPYKSIVAYDGTEFHGFQRQEASIRTVQGVLEEALRGLGWMESSLQAAGRTDTGVHARGQVICFRLEWSHAPESLTAALNAELPEDVAVRDTEVVGEEFHPRFSAQKRCYSYRVYLRETRDPLVERFAWRRSSPIDDDLLQLASGLFSGTHDYGAFGTAPVPDGSTVRTVFASAWHQTSEGLHFRIEANAFLYRMVRKIVAATLEVGFGKISREYIRELLQNPEKRWEGAVAPAKGLVLENVEYTS